jgi:hypothetical protein
MHSKLSKLEEYKDRLKYVLEDGDDGALKLSNIITKSNDIMLQLNVGGNSDILVRKGVLCKYKGSNLEQTFRYHEKLEKVEGKIYIDRSPEVF